MVKHAPLLCAENRAKAATSMSGQMLLAQCLHACQASFWVLMTYACET